MSKTPENPPAFPHPDGTTDCHQCDMPVNVGGQGMTLRDWFAGQALVGHLADGGWSGDYSHFQVVANGAYRLADAMLQERGQ